MTKTVITMICATILIILFGIWVYFSMDDLGFFDGSYRYSTLGRASSYIGAGFTAIRLWVLWDRLVWLVRKVFIWGLILFILTGLGVILGF